MPTRGLSLSLNWHTLTVWGVDRMTYSGEAICQQSGAILLTSAADLTRILLSQAGFSTTSRTSTNPTGGGQDPADSVASRLGKAKA